MNKRTGFWGAAVLSLIFWSQLAYAEVVQGVILSMDSKKHLIVISGEDPRDLRRTRLVSRETTTSTLSSKNPKIEIIVSVKSFAKSKGYAALDDLQIGNPITVDAEWNPADNNWTARSIQKAGIKAHKAKFAAENQKNKELLKKKALFTAEPVKAEGRKSEDPDVRLLPNEYDLNPTPNK